LIIFFVEVVEVQDQAMAESISSYFAHLAVNPFFRIHTLGWQKGSVIADKL
jgi:hypothetical protein